MDVAEAKRGEGVECSIVVDRRCACRAVTARPETVLVTSDAEGTLKPNANASQDIDEKLQIVLDTVEIISKANFDDSPIPGRLLLPLLLSAVRVMAAALLLRTFLLSLISRLSWLYSDGRGVLVAKSMSK